MKKTVLLLLLVFAIVGCEPIDYDEYTGRHSPQTTTVELTLPPETTVETEVLEPEIVFEEIEEPEAAINAEPNYSEPLYIDSDYGIVYNLSQKQLLYGKRIDEPVTPASITKLLTALVALENLPKDFEFVIGPEIAMIVADSSKAGLIPGQVLDFEGMLCALILPSGNDAAYAIAVNVARELVGDGFSDEEMLAVFTDLMNEYMEDLGANNSSFINPDGYHANGQYSTMRDLLRLCAAAVKNPTLREICATTSITVDFISGENATFTNRNPFLNSENWDIRGLKTGFTDESRFCLAGYAIVDGSEYLTVLSGSATESMRSNDLELLLSVDN